MIPIVLRQAFYLHPRTWRFLFAALLVSSLLGLPKSAAADTPPAEPNAYVTADVNLRAGPDTDFPVLLLVPAQAAVTIYDCVQDLTWCDLSYGEERGWVAAQYVQAFYQDRYMTVQEYVPLVGLPTGPFDIRTYWNSYYRDQAFYAQLDQWTAPSGEPVIRTNSFYQPLASYGDWVEIRDQYVFVPRDVDATWRPYTRGHWADTDENGWYWVSDEPFGWATYHYGRWGFSHDVGWFWCPGTRWAPAWVAWRGSDDYLAWAPLPPAPDISVGISINIGDVPDYYWQVVPAQTFLAADISVNIIRDRGFFAGIFGRTRPLGNTTIVNNIVVNNVVNVRYVEEKTRQKVVLQRVERADAPAGGSGIGKVALFRPPSSPGNPPPRVRKLEEVATLSKTKRQATNQPTVDLAKLRNGKPGTFAALRGQPPPRPGAAQCTGGHVLISNQCQCPPRTVGNGRGVCVPAQLAGVQPALGKPGGPRCTGGRMLVANQCQCPSGTAVNGRGACVPGQQAGSLQGLQQEAARQKALQQQAAAQQAQQQAARLKALQLQQQQTAAAQQAQQQAARLKALQLQQPQTATAQQAQQQAARLKALQLQQQQTAAAQQAQQQAARLKALQLQQTAAAQQAQQQTARLKAFQLRQQQTAAAQQAQQQGARLKALQLQQQQTAAAQQAQQQAARLKTLQFQQQQAAAQQAQQQAARLKALQQQAAAQQAQQQAARLLALQQQAAAQQAQQQQAARQQCPPGMVRTAQGVCRPRG